MKIYTKTGDRGETGLFGGPRVRKSDPRVEAYGDVDELNASVGAVRAVVEDPGIELQLAKIQEELFCVGAELATPHDAKARSAIPPVEGAWSVRLEGAIDAWTQELPALSKFVLPGGSRTAAALHLARTICRRAERRAVALADYLAGGRDEAAPPSPPLAPGQPPPAAPALAEAGVDPEVLVYLNRLSDFLFVAARLANHRAKKEEPLWDPKRAE